MNMQKPRLPQVSEAYWRGIILILSLAVILFTAWCLTNGITTVFMHLYYFPIVLLAYRYRWKGFGLALLLALTYLGLVMVFDAGQEDVIVGALYRFLVFVGIAAIIAYLSDLLANVQTTLQQSAEIKERYISLAPAIILVLDRNGQITYLNKKGGEILECIPEEVTGKSWFDQFLPEKERERIKPVFSQLVAGMTELNRVVENPVLTGSGAEKIIRWHNTVLHDEAGSISGILSFGEDITEEKWTQDALRELQQFQESVITNANVWISVLDTDGTILVWNDAAEAISGYKKTGVLGKKTVWKLLYPDTAYRKKVTEEIRRIIGRDKFLENFETIIRCADGSEKTIVWNTRGMRDHEGAVTGYIAIGRDVTAQKSAETRAGESSRFLAVMINTLPIPVFFKDADGRYLGCNPPFEEYLGIPRDKIVGKTVYDISPKELADTYAAADRQMFENPVPQRYEAQVQYADGSRHDVIFYKAPFFNKDGTLGGLIGAFLDITERKRMEDALAESGSFNRSLVENLPEYLCVYGQDGRILYVNPASAKALGYDAASLAGTHIISYIAGEYREMAVAKMAARQAGDNSSYEIELVAKDGGRRSVMVKATPIQYQNRPATLLLLIDITERKQMESLLSLQNAQMSLAQQMAKIGYWSFDIATGIPTWSDVMFMVFGQDPKNGVPAYPRHRDFIHPDDWELFDTAVQGAVAGTPYNVEIRVIFPDGTLHYVQTQGYPRRGPDTAISELFGISQDITERKRSEEALHKSEEKFRIIADFTFDWEYWLAPDGTFVYMSPSCERITGYTDREFYENPRLFSEIIHPDDKPAYDEHLDRSSLSDSPESVEYRIIRKDGGIRWISHLCQPMISRNGGNLGRRSSNRDETERKLAELALRQNEEKYRAFFTTSRDCVFITTLDGRWVDFNDAAVKLFGYGSREELLQVKIPQIYANAADRDTHIAYIRKHGYSFEYPVDLRKKDGTIINTLITTVVRKDESGSVLGFQGSIRDVTERKTAQDRIEALLRTQEEQVRIINTSPAVAFLWKAEENWPVESVSENISLFGYTRDDFLSGRIQYSAIIHPDDLEPVSREVEYNSSHNIDDYTQEYRILGKSQEIFWVADFTHIRRNATGTITHYEGVILDITGRKRAEDAVAAAVRLNQQIDTMSVGECMSFTLDEAERITASKIGFFHLLNPDEQTLDLIAWSTETKKQCFIPKEPERHYPVAKAGVWVDCIRERRPIIHNDYASLPGKKGLPEGHVPVIRELVVPIFNEDRIVAIIGVGNKATDYDEKDTSVLTLLAKNAWTLIQRKNSQEALRSSEGRLHTLVQTIPDLIWLKDKEGVYLSCNAMFERFFGAKEADIVGKTDYDFVSKELADFFRENDRKAMEAGKPTRNEEWITFADDGHKALLETTKTPVVDVRGTLIGVLGIGRDITERRHAEEEREKVRWWQSGANHILETILSPLPLDEKLKVVTDGVVDIFGADFCRIWLIDKGDRCQAGCMHAGAVEGPHVCRYRDKCLHLKASSGRYTHLDGNAHRRVPFGAYKIGRIASGEDIKFLTNDVEHDPRVHDHEWAKSLGLVSFAGYRLKPLDGEVQGVFALFAKFPISPEMDAILEGLSRAISLAIQKDIADRALRESEERVRTIVEQSPLSIQVLSPDGRTLQVNHAFEELWGLVFEDLKDYNILKDEQLVRLGIMPYIQKGFSGEAVAYPPVEYDGASTLGIGAKKWVQGNIYPVRDAAGAIRNVILVHEDISDRKQAEEALRESRQLFADIISFLPDPTFVIDKDGMVVAWNHALEQLSGVPAGEITGKGDYEYSIWMYGKRRPILIDLVLNPDKDAARLDYIGIHWEGRTVTAQTEVTRAGSGQKVPLSLVASPLIDAQGKVTGAIESMRDISHVKEAEAALARLNASLESIVRKRTQALEEEVVQRKYAELEVQAALDYTRSVIEANPDLMAVLDRSGSLLDINSSMVTMTGKSREQLIGTPYMDYLEDDGTLKAAFQDLLEKGRIEYYARMKRSDGTLTPLSLHAVVVRGSGESGDRIIVAAHDITRQKQDEEAIRASLEEKVLLLREVHHRVKNNLQIIISLTNLQMRQTDDPGVKQIMSETQNRVRAMSLVHEKLYRSESLSRIDFSDYTRFLATQLFSYYGTDTRRVKLEFAMGKIMVDINTAVPLGLLMNELVSNALKHAFPGGREGTISISGSDENNLITLVVRDDGIGIPRELDWLNTTSLGMRLVTSLIDQVGGTIALDRENGTVFTVSVKRDPASGGTQ